MADSLPSSTRSDTSVASPERSVEPQRTPAATTARLGPEPQSAQPNGSVASQATAHRPQDATLRPVTAQAPERAAAASMSESPMRVASAQVTDSSARAPESDKPARPPEAPARSSAAQTTVSVRVGQADDAALARAASLTEPAQESGRSPASPQPVTGGRPLPGAQANASSQPSVQDPSLIARRPAKSAASGKAKGGRPKPGERRVQILQTLATMLQEPGSERVTTAALARRLDVSEAALYRHFASKAQMFEGLIDFIERTVFSLIIQITAQETDALRQLRTIIGMLLAFAEKNPGMSRVLVGEALVNEDARLQVRINEITDRLETALKQVVRNAVGSGRLPAGVDAGARANLILAFVLGRWLRFAKSGFKHRPTEGIEQMVAALVA